MKQRDILLVMSDQHSWAATGFCDNRLDTPHMERIAAEGTLYERCYCSGPICVPSRMSFLTGRMPSQLEIFNNDTALASDVPTIAHDMGGLGYHTVLLGRMHFKGDDQNHGFQERLCGDITSQYWGTGGKHREDFGEYRGTTNRKHCLKLAGGGISPVMYYDKLVFEEALRFLDVWKEKKEQQPLFLVVGFYSPHFPFVSEPELFFKYQKRISVQECEEAMEWPTPSVYGELIQKTEAEHMRDCQAAYFGLTERLDSYVGAIYDAFKAAEEDRSWVFGYTSDHGEQLGKRGIFGKQTFYEDAVRVPLILAGTDIEVKRVRYPVSLLDLAEALKGAGCETSGADLKRHSWVRIQQMLTHCGKKLLAEAAVNSRYKVIRAGEDWYVYDLETDPQEKADLTKCQPDAAREQIALACEAGCFLEERENVRACQREEDRCKQQERLKAWGEVSQPDEWATVKIPPGILRYPENEIKEKV